jgi:diacylglycerol O-acyltransferase / wax synthase
MARAERLSPLDAAFLYWERPQHRMHVGCVALLDGPIAFEEFAAVVGERLGRLPRYRQRPVRPLLDLDWPHWEDDATFDVRRHVRHVAVPAPGGEPELHALIDTLFATRLDPRHPLWETYLIDGLAGGGSAILSKVHHSMIDGVSGAQVLETMADPAPHAPPHVGTHAPEPRSLLASLRPAALRERAHDVLEAAGLMASLVLRPPSTLPFNGPITDARRIVWASFALDDFLTMRGNAGCKVNDVVLAVIAGALRRYLVARGVRPEGLRVRALVPVSIRRAEDHLALGNLVSSMFPTLPVDVADPVARLGRVAEEMRALKERGQPRAAGLAMQAAGMLPAPVNAVLGRLMMQRVPLTTVCTNVPGPREACHLLGRRIVEVHPIVPLFQGMGLEFAIMSYAGRLSISATADPHLVPDVDDLAGHLRAAADELVAALAVGEERRNVSADRPRVADLMTREPVTIGPRDSLARAWTLMRDRRIRHLPVLAHDGRLTGILTHRDVLAASPSSLGGADADERFRTLALASVAHVMETHVSVAAPDDDAAAAGERMIRHKIGCLPVVEQTGRLLGIVTEEDFVRWAARRMEEKGSARAGSVLTMHAQLA